MIEDNTISGKIAKEVFADMFKTIKKPAVIVEEKGLKQITDTSAIEGIIDTVITEKPKSSNKSQRKSETNRVVRWSSYAKNSRQS